MTVTFQGVLPESRSAQNNQGIRTYSETYILTSDSRADTAYIVGSNASLPSIGDVHTEDANAYCTTLSPQCTDGYTGWTVTATWSTEREIHATDPTQDEVLVSWNSEIYQEPIFADVDGGSITNSAGDYYIDPVPTRDNVHLIARIRSNVISVPSWVLTKQNNVNDDTIIIGGLSIAAGLARMCRLTIGEKQMRNATAFYEISFEIHIHENGWHLQPLDAGFRRLVAGKPVQIRTDESGELALVPDGEEPTQPVLLDGSGGVLDVSGLPASAVFGDHAVYTESDLSILPGISN